MTDTPLEALFKSKAGSLNEKALARLRTIAETEPEAAMDILRGLPSAPAEVTEDQEIEAILKKHCGGFLGYSEARLRELLKTDRPAAMEILGGLKNAKPKKPEEFPPAPVHDPAADHVAGTAEAKSSAGEALIAEIRKNARFGDYTSAWEEARRRQPGLFS